MTGRGACRETVAEALSESAQVRLHRRCNSAARNHAPLRRDEQVVPRDGCPPLRSADQRVFACFLAPPAISSTEVSLWLPYASITVTQHYVVLAATLSIAQSLRAGPGRHTVCKDT